MGALPLALIASAGGSLLSGILGSSAATNAANAQAAAAEQGAGLNYQATQNALDLQQREWQAAQSELAPYLNAGYGALSQLLSGMGIPQTTYAAVPTAAASSPVATGGVPLSSLSTTAMVNQPAPKKNIGNVLGGSVAGLGMFGGANPLQVPAASGEQSFEAAADNLLHLAKAGYITPQQATSGMQQLLTSGQNYISQQGLGSAGSKAIANMNKVIGDVMSTAGSLKGITPQTGTLSDMSKLFVQPGTNGWYGTSLNNALNLTDQILSSYNNAGTMQPTAPAGTQTITPSSDVRTASLNAAPSQGISTGQANANAAINVPLVNGAAAQSVAPNPTNTNGALNATSLNEQWATPFTPPTAAEAAATPGYQFALSQGEQAIQRSAAAQGNLLTGGTAKDLNNYAQGMADTNYQQAFNNYLQQYQQKYNIFNNNQTNLYNKLASIAGMGQTTAGQLSSAGSNYANSAANVGMAGANAVANQYNNAAAAMGSGYVGAANAWGNTAQSLGNLPLYALAMQQGNANNGQLIAG